MRKALLSIILTVFLLGGANAQDLFRGNMILSVGLDFEMPSDKNAGLMAVAGAEFFFTDRWSLGLDLGYGASKSTYTDLVNVTMNTYLTADIEEKINTILGGPRVKNYIKLSPRIYFTNEFAFAVRYARHKFTQSIDGANNPDYNYTSVKKYKSSSMTFTVGYSPGLMYLLNNSIWLGCSVGSVMYTYKYSGGEKKQTGLKVNWQDVSVSVGFKF